MTDFDAIVIGGGPAGSTAAGFLAQSGLRVLLLEKERFPRAGGDMTAARTAIGGPGGLAE